VIDLDTYAQTHLQFTTDALPPLLAHVVRPGVNADLGCGDGAVLRALAARGLLGSTTYAVDASRERVDIAARAAPGIHGIVADAAGVAELEDASLDGVIVSQVIEHVDDDRALVREVARLLRPGGWWYVGTILRGARAWWFYRVDGVRRLDPTHIREYESRERLLDVLAHDHLEVDAVAIEPLRFPVLDLALRVLGRTGLVPADMLRNAYRAGVPEQLRAVKLRVPGYHLIEVAGHKRPYPARG
jgi:SAM-dependent methyltransferase